MKKIIISIFILAVLIAGIFIFFRKSDNELKYRTTKVDKGDITAIVTATGTVNAVTNVLIGTQVSGTIKDIYVDFNSLVKKGQVIAQIDPSVFEAQVGQARANLLAAKANLERSEATLANAKRTMERNRALFAEGLISSSDLDTAETSFETTRSDVSSVKAQVSQSEAALKIAETNLKYTRIISPVNGIIVSRNVDIGQTVAASFQTPTLFNTKMQVNNSVAEADIGKMEVGQPVEFTVDAYPDSPFKGNVSEIRNAPITVENVVTYDVVVKVDNPDLKLKPGMTANVSIIVSSKNNVIRIPNAALRFRPSEKKDMSEKREKGSGVWVLEQKKPKRIAITTGMSDGTFTELLSDEIREGQELIVESLANSKNQSRTSTPHMRF